MNEPHFDQTPTKYATSASTPPAAPPLPPLPPTPPVKRPWLWWLIQIGAAIGGGFLGVQIPITPPPLPAEQKQQLADTAAAVKRLELNQVTLMGAAGIPAPPLPRAVIE